MNILTDILMNILADILMNILTDILINILTDILMNILADILMNILTDILISLTWVWQSMQEWWQSQVTLPTKHHLPVTERCCIASFFRGKKTLYHVTRSFFHHEQVTLTTQFHLHRS